MGSDSIPPWLVRWGDMAWRLMAIGAVVYFGFIALRTVSVVILAVVVSVFLAAVLWVPAGWLRRHSWPPALAAITTLIAALLALAGVILFIVPQVASNVDSLGRSLTDAAESVRDWLMNGPLQLTATDIDSYWNSLMEWAKSNGESSLLGGATAVVEFVTGTLLAVIATFFLLKDGPSLLKRLAGRLDANVAGKTVDGVRIGRRALADYMGGVAVVGLFDATLIGIALWIVGAPLVIPLAILVFFGAFIPLAGAFASGLLAVAVAFVNGGLTDGLVILGAVIAVQQLEGHLVMPLVFGQTLRLHPLVVLVGVTAGGLAFGLFGAFLAVPLIAVTLAIHENVVEDPDERLVSLVRG